MYKAINQWSFPAAMDALACLREAARLGYQGFEPAFYEEGPLSLQGYAPCCKALAQAARDEGIALTSLASGLYWNYPLTAASQEGRAKALDVLKAYLDAAAELGVEDVLVVPGTVGSGFWGEGESTSYDQAYERSQALLQKIEPHARALGVRIGVENVWNNFLLSPLEMARFLDELNSPYIKAYFDVGNVILFGFAEQWIRILGRRISRVHVKDFKRAIGNLDGFCDLLAGDVNFPAVMQALRETGYDGPLTAEMGAYRHAPLGLAQQTSAALSMILSM